MRRTIDPQPPHPDNSNNKEGWVPGPRGAPAPGSHVHLGKITPSFPSVRLVSVPASSRPSSHLLPTTASDGPSSHPLGFIFVLVLNLARACVTPFIQGALQTPGSLRTGWTCLHPDRGREPFGLENRVFVPPDPPRFSEAGDAAGARETPKYCPCCHKSDKGGQKYTPVPRPRFHSPPVTSLKEPRNGGNRTSAEPMAPSQSPYGGREGERVS